MCERGLNASIYNLYCKLSLKKTLHKDLHEYKPLQERLDQENYGALEFTSFLKQIDI